jgi:predicted nucleotidyltransferase
VGVGWGGGGGGGGPPPPPTAGRDAGRHKRLVTTGWRGQPLCGECNRLRDMDCEAIETALQGFFSRENRGEAAAYLFGSVARREARPDSDVDVAVLFVEEPPRTLEGLHFDLERELETLLGRPVQLVVLNRAPAYLVHRVLRESRLLSNRDPSKRVRFEVRKRNEYFDLLPILRRYWRLERNAT